MGKLKDLSDSSSIKWPEFLQNGVIKIDTERNTFVYVLKDCCKISKCRTLIFAII